MSTSGTIKNPVFCAIDMPHIEAAALAKTIAPAVGGLKLGKEFFTAHGPQGVDRVRAAGGLDLFLDLKFHDIPNTVAGAVRAALPLSPFMMTIHAAGGPAMIRAAAEAAGEAAEMAPLILAVTVLTSLNDDDLAAVGVNSNATDQVRRLAELAQANGAGGAVCSPHEIEVLRADRGPDFALVVPGIRPAGSDAGDQKRVMTPRQAMDLGATHLVIGRPITSAADPLVSAQAIADELAAET